MNMGKKHNWLSCIYSVSSLYDYVNAYPWVDEGQLYGEGAPYVPLPQLKAEHGVLPRLEAQHLRSTAVPCNQIINQLVDRLGN